MKLLFLTKPLSCLKPLHLLLVFSLVALSVNASTLHNLKLVGKGKVSWLFMEIYQARLYSETGDYRPSQFPQALAIRYSRNITSEQLLQTTVDEWSKLGIDGKKTWLDKLKTLWPSVRPGDEIVFYVPSGCAGKFYLNQQYLGEISDCDFARDFLAIWLSRDTSHPKLRSALLGKDNV